MKSRLILLAVLLLSSMQWSTAQVTDSSIYTTADTTKKQLYLVTKTDNAEFYGYILSDDGREILLETKTIGRIYISKSVIKLIKPIQESSIKTNINQSYTDYRAQGPFTTRYYFTNNALPIEKNENYAMINIYGPEIHFAVEDNLSVGIMASWIASPIAVATKYAFYSKNNTHLSAGTILASSGYLLNAKGYGGLHWVTANQGDRMKSVSLSLGYGYADLADFDGVEVGDKYNIPDNIDYRAAQAIRQKLNGYQTEYNDIQLYKGFAGSYVLGVSGITPVGKKASFIFDAIAFLGKTKEVEYSNYPITVSYFDYNTNSTITGTYVIGEGKVVDGINQSTFIIMPAMRFNTAYNKAFQVALAGVINVQGSEVVSFPIPTVGWLRQF